jgi:hypothetical protein
LEIELGGKNGVVRRNLNVSAQRYVDQPKPMPLVEGDVAKGDAAVDQNATVAGEAA